MSVIILHPLILSIIALVLGVVIFIADSILNNYGTVSVNINNGKKTLSIKGGSNILLSLAAEQIFIPSACGGKGNCGACKAIVKNDIGKHLPTEIPHLTKAEIANNTRICCQVKVKTNLELEIPEELFNIKKFVGTVEKIEELTHDLNRVYVRLPAGMPIDFIGGNYAQFEVPAFAKEWKNFLNVVKSKGQVQISNGKTISAEEYHKFWTPPEGHPVLKMNPNYMSEISAPVQRAYSISSDPNDVEHLEFLIRKVPGGILSNYVHLFMREGQKINMLAPMGEFHVHYNTLSEKNGIMICVGGGSGMAPFRSIFREMEKNGKINSIPIWYFFGAATPKDLFYVDILEQMHKKYENFHYIPALSGPPPFPKPADWKPPVEWEAEVKNRLNADLKDIEIGTITDVMDRYLKDNGRADRTKGHKILERYKEGYLCGSTGMLNACLSVMTKNGMKEEVVYFDKFG